MTGGGRWRCKGHRHGQCDNGSVTAKELALAQKTSNVDRDRIEVKLGETRERIARLVRRLEREEDAPRALSSV